MRTYKKPNFIISWIILRVLAVVMKRKSKMTSNTEAIKGLKPPYLVLANHLNNWDPLYINAVVPEPISFIAGERIFAKHRCFRKLLEYVGTIPIVKSETDLTAARKVMRAKKAGRVICIFPEGNRSWDGIYRHPVDSTAKLIKLLRIPVVTVQIKGSLLSQPRWSRTFRRGPVELDFKVLFQASEIEGLETNAILEKMNTALSHDEYAWVESHGFQYKGKKLAEGMESFLYICDHCGAEGSISTSDDLVTCERCGTSYRYNLHGLLEGRDRIISPRIWNERQRARLKRRLKNGRVVKGVGMVTILDASRNVHDRMHGELTFGINGFTVNTLNIPLAELHGVNVQKGTQFEFRYDEHIYVIEFDRQGDSVFKWHEAYLIMKGAY
ncbi:1-acyl-sn-glycerol-3-phosphate acyltransferase [Fusibacter paucivorans]|uniref:1-acyl-sn-glycerol-3-phosphate acyltransferase n=1 Tax=Fusibacter paucivorans TaxID=76009 RepID=A0ABS5PRQ1_9FIRM|nr:lysophospholipid acyltransferase family protein [Fusibacter paucivorans]MBS7527834.1 1-acyl-sn-glycerol-3-phosphate acyltransferase [Fusibacter paucivorans]